MKLGMFYNTNQLCMATLSAMADVRGMEIVSYKYGIKDNFGKEDVRYLKKEFGVEHLNFETMPHDLYIVEPTKFPENVFLRKKPIDLNVTTNMGRLVVSFKHYEESNDPLYSWVSYGEEGSRDLEIRTKLEKELGFIRDRRIENL